MSNYLHPTVEVTDYRGRKKLLSIIAVDEARENCKYCILGCNASPVWISVEALRPLIQAGRILQS